MGSLITQIFTAFTATISGLAGGIKEGFMNLIYVDATAETLVVSDVSMFIFMMLGLSMAVGIVYSAFNLIKRRG